MYSLERKRRREEEKEKEIELLKHQMSLQFNEDVFRETLK